MPEIVIVRADLGVPEVIIVDHGVGPYIVADHQVEQERLDHIVAAVELLTGRYMIPSQRPATDTLPAHGVG